MFSNLRANTRSLSARLLIGQLCLLLVVCFGIGAVTILALHQYLIGEVDNQLRETAHRSAIIYGEPLPPPLPPALRDNRPPWPRPGPGPQFLDAPGQPIGMVAAVITDGTASDAGLLGPGGVRAPVPSGATAELTRNAEQRRPVTRNLDGLGDYRVVAVRSRLTGETLVIGLSLVNLNATLLRVALTFAVVTVAALVVATTVGIVINRRALAPLTRVVATAGEVANLPLDRGEVELPVRVSDTDANPYTEVGRLGLALNRMLDHISTALSTRQASESRVRQFVADASHELRTPLAAIRGYTELAQRKRDQVPDDVAHAMGRVESEAERMTHLVEDLLLLARLDSGRPLERQPVDLSRLSADVASDAHIAGPDHEWNLDVPSDPLYVIGDDARLHQVVANLLANARTHTPPGTTVTLSLHAEPDAAVLRVVDDGPGIPAELQSEVFERFARGDTSRSRKGGSTGLGLAIASAVVRAHGGVIELASVPGLTEFTVRLPRSAQS
ncbi:sensor histidine kinase [Mycolicibacterium rhodesiae]|uniref:histidine kinase n=1 Tax=Mycolicibacterium rhodesiae TaxID=36814 RepID=A0A1X0ILU3_MYCRH|nr:HAMP domain-containing sensor histidine kinase [Mycolicibacterium rhodesiae]MCV7343601.1 HAMP domain-containing histidine kinase [Mycolicibacterium rhodesiae]ORB49041.1 two-component sensor histidine kinase [Mycolicibacterium rhodesiae]